jgi:hypothetical protein
MRVKRQIFPIVAGRGFGKPFLLLTMRFSRIAALAGSLSADY